MLNLSHVWLLWHPRGRLLGFSPRSRPALLVGDRSHHLPGSRCTIWGSVCKNIHFLCTWQLWEHEQAPVLVPSAFQRGSPSR